LRSSLRAPVAQCSFPVPAPAPPFFPLFSPLYPLSRRGSVPLVRVLSLPHSLCGVGWSRKHRHVSVPFSTFGQVFIDLYRHAQRIFNPSRGSWAWSLVRYLSGSLFFPLATLHAIPPTLPDHIDLFFYLHPLPPPHCVVEFAFRWSGYGMFFFPLIRSAWCGPRQGYRPPEDALPR